LIVREDAPLTRYFIDTSNGVVSLADEVGADYLTEAMARSEALQAASDMARDYVHRGGNRDMTVSVRDPAGTVVYAVRLSLLEVTNRS
jgi:hypothetical protein